MKIYRGNIVYSKSRDELCVHRDAFIAVERGIVEGIYEQLPEKLSCLPVTDFGNNVLIPAFSDLHVHAPQYPQRGLGMDCLLADWLNTYTFPQEARYSDPEYARTVYEAFLNDLIANGTFHACVYGTIHRESTSGLLERMEELKLRAFVGKEGLCLDHSDAAVLSGCRFTAVFRLMTLRRTKLSG